MIKAQRLRTLITDRVPFFKTNPDKLKLFVSKGRIITTAYGSAGYTQEYEAQLVCEDYNSEPDFVFLAVVEFMREQELSSLANPLLAHEAIQFEAEALTHDTYDLLITLKLSESVTVDADKNITHHPALVNNETDPASLFVHGTNQQVFPIVSQG